MKFLIDRCAGRRIADWLRSQGHDVIEALERHPDPGDEEILAWSVREGRVLVTMDKDFGALIFLRGAPHCGVIRLPHVRTPERIAIMDRLLARYTADEIAAALVTVRGNRIRISRRASD